MMEKGPDDPVQRARNGNYHKPRRYLTLLFASEGTYRSGEPAISYVSREDPVA